MKITKKSYKKLDDPIFKESFKTLTLKKKEKDKIEDTYYRTLPSCNTKRFDEQLNGGSDGTRTRDLLRDRQAL